MSTFGLMGGMELIIMLVLGGGVGIPMGVPPQPEDPLMARVAPDECLFYTTWSATAAPTSASENQTEQLLAEPEVQHLITELQSRIKTGLRDAAGKNDPQAAAIVDDATHWATVLLKNPAAIFVSKAGIGPAGPEINAGALVSAGDEAAKLEAVLKKYQAVFLRDAAQPVTIGTANCYRITLDPKTPPITWCVRGKYLLVGVGAGALEGIMTRARTAAPKWLSGIRAQLPVDRVSTVSYVNLERIVDTLGPLAGQEAAAAIEALGVGSVTTMASVTGLDKQGFVNRTLLGIDGEPQGVFSFASAKPLGPEDLAAIPADSTVAVAARLDADKLFETFLSVLGKIEPRAGEEITAALGEIREDLGMNVREDLLAPLGDAWRVYNAPSEGGLVITGLTAVVAVDDHEKLLAAQARLLAVAKAALAEESRGQRVGPRIEQFEFAGKTIYFFNARDDEFPLAPSWCLTEKELIVAAFPQNVKAYLSRGEGFRSLAEVAGVSEAFDLDGGPLALAYVDTRALFDLAYPIVPFIAQAAMSGLAREGIDVDVSIVPSAAAIRKHLRPSVASLRRNAAGIEFTSRQSLPGGSVGATAPLAVAFLLPAVQAARSSARRVQSMNNLKQIGLAAHNHAADTRKFPAAYSSDEDGKPLLSWRVHILPYLEGKALYEQFHLDEPWDSEHNKQLISRMPSVYKPAGSKAAPGMTNYLGVGGEGGIFPGSKKIGIADIRDGSSNTIMVVEAADASAVPWTKPVDFVSDEDDPTSGLVGLRPNGFNALFCDGSVRFIHETIDSDTLKALFTRAGGEAVDHDEF